MRPLSFGGFLKQYVRELSKQNTLSIFRLAKEADHENPRLREPLVLYALFHDKSDVLFRATEEKWLDIELLQHSPEKLLSMMGGDSLELPENYKKVYRSYCSVTSKKHTDSQTKELLRKRIMQCQEEKGVSNYRLYRDFNLNHGNVNAYLKHGDTGKVCLNTARKMLEQAKA